MSSATAERLETRRQVRQVLPRHMRKHYRQQLSGEQHLTAMFAGKFDSTRTRPDYDFQKARTGKSWIA